MPVIYAINPTRTKRRKPVNRKRRTARKSAVKRKRASPTKKKRIRGKIKSVARRTTVKSIARANKGGRKMARRKRGRKRAVRRRRNPTRTRTVVRYRQGAIGGINFGSVLKSTIAMGFGAIAGKFVAKRFAEGGGEADNWTWKNYLLCLGGGFIAAQFTRVFLNSTAKANDVMKGSALLALYKFITNEIAPANPTLEAWFGEEIDPYGGYGESFNPYADGYGYGDIYQGGEQDWVQGIDGAWRPIDESHRLPDTAGYGDVMVEPSARFGDVMVPVSSRYGGFGGGVDPNVFERDGM